MYTEAAFTISLKGNFQICIPVNEARADGYIGRGTTFPFGANVIEVPVSHIKEMEFDCILFQCSKNYLVDQYEVLSARNSSYHAFTWNMTRRKEFQQIQGIS